jgi:hypothetical protein
MSDPGDRPTLKQDLEVKSITECDRSASHTGFSVALPFAGTAQCGGSIVARCMESRLDGSKSLEGSVSNEFVAENKVSPEKVAVEGLLERLTCVETFLPLIAVHEISGTLSRILLRSDDVSSNKACSFDAFGSRGALSNCDGHDRGMEPQRLTSTRTFPMERGMAIVG